jgi:hypothetical protein
MKSAYVVPTPPFLPFPAQAHVLAFFREVLSVDEAFVPMKPFRFGHTRQHREAFGWPICLGGNLYCASWFCTFL